MAKHNVIEMSIKEWSEVPACPVQRDTKKHADYAIKRHLKTYSPLHEVVFAAVRGDDILCKLDGHTRSYLWDAGMLDAPPSGNVRVVLVEASSIEHAIELYDGLDSRTAVETLPDKVSGGARKAGITFTSRLLKGYKFAYALKVASGLENFDTSRIDTHNLVCEWSNELRIIDSANLPQIHGGMLTLTFCLVRLGDNSICDFMREVHSKDCGVKDGDQMCGVYALSHMMEMRRAKKRVAGIDNQLDIMARAYTAFRAWSQGRMIRGKSLDASEMGKIVKAVQATINRDMIVKPT